MISSRKQKNILRNFFYLKKFPLLSSNYESFQKQIIFTLQIQLNEHQEKKCGRKKKIEMKLIKMQ